MGSADCSFSLSSFSLSRRRTPNATWLTGFLFVSDVPEWLFRYFDQPWRHKDFLKAAMSFPLFLSKLPWVLIWTSRRSMLKSLTNVLHCLEEKQTQDRNQLLQENQTHRQQNPLYPHLLVHSHHQCWCVSVHKFWVLAWRKMWEQLQCI